VKRFALILLLASSASGQTLSAAVDHAISTPELAHAIWAVDVEDDAGRVVYQHNAHTLMMPASNRKIFAASTALDCLGPDSRYVTELWRDGDDLVIRGSGDPTLGG